MKKIKTNRAIVLYVLGLLLCIQVMIAVYTLLRYRHAEGMVLSFIIGLVYGSITFICAENDK